MSIYEEYQMVVAYGGLIVASMIEILLMMWQNSSQADDFNSCTYHFSLLWLWSIVLAADILMSVESISGKQRRQCSDLIAYNGIALVCLGVIYSFGYPIYVKTESARLKALQAN
jgi:hypothetical protein